MAIQYIEKVIKSYKPMMTNFGSDIRGMKLLTTYSVFFIMRKGSIDLLRAHQNYSIQSPISKVSKLKKKKGQRGNKTIQSLYFCNRTNICVDR